ncbi:AAA family ATPase [Geomonas agri]|uniref:AAA family ATPase n=1 Tax=Geomonas agri TaxID=2873702 RepID=UPI001CD33574|nr:AAA family ATPase [Geomonas agri]
MTSTADLERDLLTALLAEGTAYANTAGLTPADFWEDDHGELFKILGQIPAAPGAVPPALIGANIPNKGKRHRLTALVAELYQGDVAAVLVSQIAQAVKSEARNREIAAAAQILAKSPGNEAAKATLAALLETGSASRPTRALFLSASEFLQEEAHIAYLIAGLIERDTTGQLFGPSGGGKTFVALHQALAVATGGNVHGHRAERGLVLYLAGEGHGGLRRRVKAYQKHHGIEPHCLGLFHVSRQTISFDGSGLPAAKAEAKALADAFGTPVALIVVDTLARHLDGDENSTSDMNRFVAAVDDLRSAFPGAVALIVHHSGHGEETKKRARGSSALKAAMDFEICCDRGLLTFTKMKDSEAPEPIPFKLRPVQIGASQDGTPLASCVVEFGERSERDKVASFTTMERIAAKALVVASKRTRTDHNGKAAALVSDWRDDFYALRRTDDPEAKTNTLKNAFLRAETGLIEKKSIAADGHLRILTASLPSYVTTSSQSVTYDVEEKASHRHTPL